MYIKNVENVCVSASKRDSDSKIYRNVKGSLRQQLGYWKSIEANAAVIKTISEGYKIHFITTPKPAKI